MRKLYANGGHTIQARLLALPQAAFQASLFWILTRRKATTISRGYKLPTLPCLIQEEAEPETKASTIFLSIPVTEIPIETLWDSTTMKAWTFGQPEGMLCYHHQSCTADLPTNGETRKHL